MAPVPPWSCGWRWGGTHHGEGSPPPGWEISPPTACRGAPNPFPNPPPCVCVCPPPPPVPGSVCQFLSRCQSPKGGFGGGPGQYPHLAPTYAAVNTLCIIGTEEAFGVIDRYGRRRYGVGGGPGSRCGAGEGRGGQDLCVPPPILAAHRVSQEEAAGVPALAEAARWLLPHARRRRGGRQVGSRWRWHGGGSAVVVAAVVAAWWRRGGGGVVVAW